MASMSLCLTAARSTNTHDFAGRSFEGQLLVDFDDESQKINYVYIGMSGSPQKTHSELFSFAKVWIKKHGAQIGFDPKLHKLVIPQPPYKDQARKIRYPTRGGHITVAYTKELAGIPRKSLDGFEGQPVPIGLSQKSKLLMGHPKNDEATGVVYYLVVDVDSTTAQKVQAVRKAMGLKTMERIHMSIAGIAPKDGDFKKFRYEFCEDWPEQGFPKPVEKLGIADKKKKPGSSPSRLQQQQRL